MTAVYMKQLQDELRLSEQKFRSINKSLTDSIDYAKYIQDAFVVKVSFLRKLFEHSFLVQRPKDTVSGDFVWAFENGLETYLAVGDCTGHGVPGAMLSIFVISMLNQIASSQNKQTPSGILEELDALIHKYLSQYSEVVRDSAEIAMIRYNKTNGRMLFSGAKRPLIHIRDHQMTQHKGAKYVLGNNDRRDEIVNDTEVHIQNGDMIYMFSDGFADQFGGQKNAKFSTKRLLSLLLEVSNSSIDQQDEHINFTYDQWKGQNGQIDDVLLLGIRL